MLSIFDCTNVDPDIVQLYNRAELAVFVYSSYARKRDSKTRTQIYI